MMVAVEQQQKQQQLPLPLLFLFLFLFLLLLLLMLLLKLIKMKMNGMRTAFEHFASNGIEGCGDCDDIAGTSGEDVNNRNMAMKRVAAPMRECADGVKRRRQRLG